MGRRGASAQAVAGAGIAHAAAFVAVDRGRSRWRKGTTERHVRGQTRGGSMKLRTRALLFALVTACAMASPASHQFAAAQGQAVAIKVDAQKRIGPMKPIWAWFGYDEPNYTYMKDGKKLLTELSKLSPVPVYVRVHNLLTTGDGT